VEGGVRKGGLSGRSCRFELMRAGILIGLLAAMALASCSMAKASLKVGDVPPDFALPDQTGAAVRLSDFRGKRTVVLAFYIKAFTSG
jgi:cytochrome oxidase Cu insertion factor (SCO1/SenC/PrrC family)